MATLLNNLPAIADDAEISASAAVGDPGANDSIIGIGNELLKVIAGAGTANLLVSRAVGDSTLEAHAVGDAITDADTATYDAAHSYQVVGPDLTLAAGAGSDADPKYLAAIMGNVIGDALTKLKPILAGVIGKLSITGARATSYSVAAVRGEIGDGVSAADGAFVAVIGGDSAQTKARAAFTVDSENSTAGSAFDYGIDLVGPAAHDGYNAVSYTKSPIKAILPTSDPGEAGAWWVDTGVIKISAG